MELNGIFDKVYCINLDKRKDKWVEVQKEFKKQNILVERFSGINGNPKKVKSRLRAGQIGCLESHLQLVKLAKKNGYDQIFIFEDDAVFADNFQEVFSNSYKDVPVDWDMLYLSGNHIKDTIHVENSIHKLTHTYTTGAYGIKSTMFDTVISKLSEYDAPVDVYYAYMHAECNAYIIKPHLCWQKEGYSDTLGRKVNYDKWLKK